MPLAPIPVRLPDGRRYDYVIGSLFSLADRMRDAGLRPGLCFVVTDVHLAAPYGAPLVAGLRAGGWEPHLITLPAGETTKAPEHLQTIYDAALAAGIDRKTPIVALGGGVVGDLAGYAAATLLRGVPLVQVPTSLIAQVDSAIGGKTGINHGVGKNLIGAFHQPHLVYADMETLGTLPEREWFSGLAEVVKHALIADPDLFDRMESQWEGILGRDMAIVPGIIHRAAAIKIEVVQEDERESGRRAILNFGHTFGHAIERVAGYGAFTHGEAVAVGMIAALQLSRLLYPGVDFDRAERLVRRIPVEGTLHGLSRSALRDAMQSDKKKAGTRLRFVVLDRPGHATVAENVSEETIDAAWDYASAD
ncbi:MAG: 3-dehydroquinate synthase [Rhodothermales bacterium]